MILNKYATLKAACKGMLSAEEMAMLDKAFRFAQHCYGDSKTSTGEPAISHVLAVARVAAEEMGLGPGSIMACLLHDTLLKQITTADIIQKELNPTIASLVKGYTRISELPTEKVSIQSESFRKLFLAVVDDVRVILIMMAHRLNDMRNIDKLPEDRQKKFHQEVIHLYSPIAHRLGLYRIKKEMEELTMKFTDPATYKMIAQKIRETEGKRNAFINEFIAPIQRELTVHGFRFDIKGRPKSIPSIWDKMKRQDVAFEEVFDLFAIRIILDTKQSEEKADCWRAYSIVTNIYPPNPKRLRDWISSPKASGYESLHTTVKGPGGKWAEVQIRSVRMDELAEKGQAAHWRYKGFGSKKDTEDWLNQVRDIIEHPEQINFDEAPAVGKTKPQDKVYVFTPNGDLKELPAGSTVLDFAFEVHTNVGYSCTGARINDKIVPLKQKLSNGDKVEIMTSKGQKPKMDWLGFAVTSKAIGKIKRALKEDEFLAAEKGNEILRRKLRNWKIHFNDENIDKLIRKFKLSSSIDLYAMIYREEIDLLEIKRHLSGEPGKKPEKPMAVATDLKPSEITDLGTEVASDVLELDRNLDKVNYKLAKCCHPIPGDPVFGFITISRGITIHRTNCPNARQLLTRYGYRKIDIRWKETAGMASFEASIRVTGLDRIGIMNEISQVISNDTKTNMISLKVDARGGIFTGLIKLVVRSSDHLEELISKLLKIHGLTKATRIR